MCWGRNIPITPPWKDLTMIILNLNRFRVYPNRIEVNYPLVRVPWGCCGWVFSSSLTFSFYYTRYKFSTKNATCNDFKDVGVGIVVRSWSILHELTGNIMANSRQNSFDNVFTLQFTKNAIHIDNIISHPFDRGAFGFKPIRCCSPHFLCCIWPIYGEVVGRQRCPCNGSLWPRLLDCGGCWCDEW